MSEVTDSSRGGSRDRTGRPGKRDRLVAAARDLVYRQGVSRTTLADIAEEADVPVGNVYYYFKTKDEIVGAVVRARADELRSSLEDLERRHRRPTTRLKALMGLLGSQRESIAQYGCPYGTLDLELVKSEAGPDTRPGPLLEIPLTWVEQQFRALGRRDAHSLSVQLVASYQGAAVLASALGQPELMASQVRQLKRWIDGLAA